MLPGLLMVSEPGSFAEQTIVRRKPRTIADVIAYNSYPEELLAALHALAQEIAQGWVAPLHEEAPDVDAWQRAWLPWEGKTWRQLGWYYAEAYFYRRVLEAVRYFQPGLWRLHDPFEAQKREAIQHGIEELGALCSALPAVMPDEMRFSWWFHRSLWGNRVDLSNTTVKAEAMRRGLETSDGVLIDHTDEVWSLLRSGQVRRLDLVADNSGLELLSDLGLLDFLLSGGVVEAVHLHLKSQPFFVSDAMVKDYTTTVEALLGAAEPAMRDLGRRLGLHQAQGRLLPEDHPFWTTSHFFPQLPPDLHRTLSGADLLVFKGDANYRRLVEDRHWPPTSRLVEDRHWPPTSSLEEITAYVPSPYVVLRTLKSELIVGLPQGKAEEIARQDPDWLINGERGVIHFVPRRQAP